MPCRPETTILRLLHTVPEGVKNLYDGRDGAFRYDPAEYVFDYGRSYDDLETYAREIAWYGRKGGLPLTTNVRKHERADTVPAR